ncbi:bifunctional phosphatase PAP2/diacylglycerol kinase family protein [Streptomyces sp. AJS327]|uniref:bifunctional phosphatase PAP2/diacylglycerol kinase family protein n=1 Tax=Streptomyces sp. AJS327 TaxID=2545265 RepID=UPI002155A84D|nr:phosphatase PAP2 family protein [Streptomyces sp. AJS327]
MRELWRDRARRALTRADLAVFERVAARNWPGAEALLPRLSRSANRGLLWFGVGAGMWALGDGRARRAAARGALSLALASVTVNTLGKRSVRRGRPLLDAVPVARRLPSQPVTTSFPSGHAASAAAFAIGVALEAPRWGAVLAPAAAAVGFSRIYSGVHYPSDVLAGAAFGAGAALSLRGMAPTRAQLPPPGRPRGDAPALPEGAGLVVVVNPSSGAQPQLSDPVRQLRQELPRAELVWHREESGPLPDVLDEAADRARNRGGALGVVGGDGTVNAAALAALRAGVPLAVFPGGTFNHFAADLGAETVPGVCAAVESGRAIRADVGRVTPLGARPVVFREHEPDRSASRAQLVGEAAGSGQRGGVRSLAGRALDAVPGPTLNPVLSAPVLFLNTFSLGVYPDLVRVRERWSPRIGGPAATLLGVVRVLRTAKPVRAEVNGRPRSLWLLFAGNGAYRSVGIAPVRRFDLADGLLDVRAALGGRFARTRLLAAAVLGGLARTPVYATARPSRMYVAGLPVGARMAYDGEVAPAPSAFVLDKLPEALTVYRPEVN